MGEEDCHGRDLLDQLELILKTDRLICEIGFLLPSQFTTLSEDTGGSLPQHAKITKSADGTLDKDTSVFDAMQYDKTVFWYSDHKLAISLEVLPQLYSVAMIAYKDARRGHGKLVTSSDVTVGASGVHYYENEILKHSEVLLILSCDFTSIWNSRKLVLSRKHILSLFMGEFQLSKLILSYSPKCDYAWSHRRWVIKMIGEHFPDLQEIIENESELVKEIAEKSKMNYRAWNHRCWLVSYMTKAQVHNELIKSRKWAEFHVGDNCCFHYRRGESEADDNIGDDDSSLGCGIINKQLMLSMLENCYVKQDGETSFNYKADIHSVWKDELNWNELLIDRYIGREALWIHRRFLSQCWIKHFCRSHQEATPCLEDLDVFMGKEWQLLHNCQNTSVNEFEDAQVQAQHAASYILWIYKVSKLQVSKLEDKLREVGGFKDLMIKTCPERTVLWESFLD